MEGRREAAVRRCPRAGLLLLAGVATLLSPQGRAQEPAATPPQAAPPGEPAPREAEALGLPELDKALEALREARGGDGEEERRALREALAERERRLAEQRRELDRLAERIRRLEEEKAALEGALAATREALASRDERIAEENRETRRRLEERERELAILRRDNLSLTEKLARQREEKRKIAEERARLRLDLDNAERQITELTASLEQAWKERDLADAEVEARDARLAELRERLDALSDRLALAETERDRLRATLVEREKALARADERETALGAELARLRRAVSVAAGALAEAAAELAATRADLRTREAEIAALEASNADLSRALDAAREKAGRYRRILEALRERVEPETAPSGEMAAATEAAAAEPPTETTPPAETARPAESGTLAAVSDGTEAEDGRAPTGPGTSAPRTIPVEVLAGDPSARFRAAAEALGFALRADGERGLTTVLRQVHFAVDSTDLTPESLPELARLAELLRRFPDVRATVAGHTDAAGDADYNRELSQARAEEVRRLLVERYGIAGERLRAVGYGEDRPLAPNDTAEGRRRNRRVEIHFAWPPAEGGDGG